MKNYLIYLPLLALLAWGGCKPCDDPTDPECPNYCVDPANPRCPNYDPCYGKSDVSAAFRMEENAGYVITDSLAFRYVDTDTVSIFRVRFTALDPHATYEWHIGAGRYSQRQFTLLFDEVQRNAPGSTIPITLIVSRPPDTLCFPGSTGRDTLTRYLTIMEECSNRITGSFLGRWVNKPGQTDTFTVRISISDYPYYSSKSCDLNTITNLAGPGSDCANWSTGITHGYRHVTIGNDFGPEPGLCDLDMALAWTEQGSDSVTIQYRMRLNPQVPSSPTAYFVFKGIRTNN